MKRLAVPGPVQTPEAAAGALHTLRERLALLDAILTNELHEVQDARARAA